MIDDEKKLAETPAGFLLFKYVESLERAWKEDARLADTEPTPKRFLRVRECFRIADQYRAALVRTMLDEPNIARMLDVSTAICPPPSAPIWLLATCPDRWRQPSTAGSSMP